jgi:hypothetical protein
MGENMPCLCACRCCTFNNRLEETPQMKIEIRGSQPMSRQTLRYRIKEGISLDLPVGYKNGAWDERLPEIMRLIVEGETLETIAECYGVTKSGVNNALRMRGYGVRRIRYDFERGILP